MQSRGKYIIKDGFTDPTNKQNIKHSILKNNKFHMYFVKKPKNHIKQTKQDWMIYFKPLKGGLSSNSEFTSWFSWGQTL